MDFIEIRGYKSIRQAKIDLRPINILIGANGSGKSNFLSFFELLNNLYERKLTQYVALNGGEDKFLHHGGKVTTWLGGMMSFDKETNTYQFVIEKGTNGFVFRRENLYFHQDAKDINSFESESRLKLTDNYRAKYILGYLNGLKKYHFHDTSKNSPFNSVSRVPNDTHFLYEKGDNLAAFLYQIQKENTVVYYRIVKIIQSIAPYFSDFFLQPNTEGYIRLQWQDKFSSNVYGATDLSDGTIRFIALTVLFMQPNLPQTLIIDEPELGLHPVAIAKFAGMIQSVADKGTQVIVATQSTDLVSHFQPEDIIAVDQKDGVSRFKRLENNELETWLEDYTIGDLWKRNIITEGQP